ncbi:unnamed protein product [Brachionus calyciflorus]|uniref:O-acyltransferase n=1 Tax=Brachionus calyciflorus TaxID=104777 RepID=A0A813M150_9BILA|nr:unnamed protein product [Brachionus calyciflorus]
MVDTLSENSEKIQFELECLNRKINQFLLEIKPKNDGQKSPTNGQNMWSSLNMTTKAYSTSNSKDSLPERIFIKRNSLLTEMFKLNHIRTIRHIFISIMIVLALQVIYNDLTEKGTFDYNFDLIRWSFDKFNVVCYTWLYMIISTTCLVYFAFHFWSNDRIKQFAHDPKNLFKYDLLWLSLYLVYLGIFLLLPCYTVISNALPVASTLTILLEQLRMLMKTHAFVRSNITRALENGSKKMEALRARRHKKTNSLTIEKPDESSSEDEQTPKKSASNDDTKLCPDFSCYLYFLFAPTLVYRDNYPRNSRIRWKNVCSNFAQVLGAILYTHYIFSRFCIPVFKHFNTDSVTLKMFIHSILNCTLPGTLLLLVAFFAFLHCWLNAWAEMLRFSDRMFYKDWWNSTNFSNYYRTWNVVVHDWLYTYIYKDLFHLFGKENKTLCQFGIFFLSAIFHEYILTLAFGYFYPVMFLQFGAIGFLCLFIKSNKNENFWNLILWMGLLIGLGGQMCLYSIEWYARQNCPQSFESKIVDYLLPRSFTCGMGKSLNGTFHYDQIRSEF